jgi:hypothetical protein
VVKEVWGTFIKGERNGCGCPQGMNLPNLQAIVVRTCLCIHGLMLVGSGCGANNGSGHVVHGLSVTNIRRVGVKCWAW